VENKKNSLKIEALSFFSETMAILSALPFDKMAHAIADAVESIVMCSGKVVTSGMGKNGNVAEKVASLFSSLGTPSCYLHPAGASHGDVGVVVPTDILMVFSTSGKTREVVETIDLTRRLGIAKVISVTSHPDSPIKGISDIVIDIGIVKEAGHLRLAPTTSIMAMLMVADAIATGCAKTRNFTVEDYSLRHHGGYLGRKCRGEEP
jgi:arabinose-5-phosphate isomerase